LGKKKKGKKEGKSKAMKAFNKIAIAQSANLSALHSEKNNQWKNSVASTF